MMTPELRLPSLHRLAIAARDAVRRFPLVLACATVATIAGFIGIGSDWETVLPVRVLFTAALGIALFVALRLFSERRALGPARTALLDLLGLAALGGFLIAWAGWSDQVAFSRVAQLALAFHLLVAFLPYVGYDEPNGFWQFNRALFMRFLMGGLYSVVLFVGLSIALLAIDNLLGIELAEASYARLWLVVAFMFSTWFFVADLPEDLAALNGVTDFPAALKVFAQFILVPLVTIYLLILTFYLGKVVITREWPSGWIGYLVSSVSAIGILALLLVHPVRDREENRWVDSYSRWFFIALIPSIVMLLMSIGKRIGQYGVTENRYFLAVLGVWLAGISLYYILTRARTIRPIPITLCVVALATFLGPWSAYAFAKRSQTARLQTLLETDGMLANGTVSPAASGADISPEARREISAVVRYLVSTHGVSSIAPWFEPPVATIDSLEGRPSSSASTESRAGRIVEALGIEYVSRGATLVSDRFNYYASREGQAVSVAGYDLHYHSENLLDDGFEWQGGEFRIDSLAGGQVISLSREGVVLAEIPLAPIVETARGSGLDANRPLEREALRIVVDGPGAGVELLLSAISGTAPAEGLEIRTAAGDLYIDLRAEDNSDAADDAAGNENPDGEDGDR